MEWDILRPIIHHSYGTYRKGRKMGWQVPCKLVGVYRLLVELAREHGWECPAFSTGTNRWLVSDGDIYGNPCEMNGREIVTIERAIERIEAGPPEPPITIDGNELRFDKEGRIHLSCGTVVASETVNDIIERRNKAVDPTANAIRLLLTRQEAQTLRDILGCSVAGTGVKREQMDSVWNKLLKLGFKNASKRIDFRGCITFH